MTGVALPRRVIQGFRAKNPRSRQAAVKFNKIREKCEKSDTEQGSASSLNARLFRADVEKGTILI